MIMLTNLILGEVTPMIVHVVFDTVPIAEPIPILLNLTTFPRHSASGDPQ